MNKLITIEQIIKRNLYKNENKDDSINNQKINYEIGKNNNIPYIKCMIKINKDDINNLQKLIGNKNKKRNKNVLNIIKSDEMDVDIDADFGDKNTKQKIKNNEKEEDKINTLCIQNIQEFFK